LQGVLKNSKVKQDKKPSGQREAPKVFNCDELEIIDYSKTPKDVTSDDYGMDAYSAKSSLSSANGGILKLTQRKEDTQRHSFQSLTMERKAMTINFI
jgi:hypothetical protein